MRRHLAQPDKHFSKSGAKPCIFVKLVSITTTAQLELPGAALQLVKKESFAQVFDHTSTRALSPQPALSCRFLPPALADGGTPLLLDLGLSRAKIGTKSAVGVAVSPRASDQETALGRSSSQTMAKDVQ